ncbi:DgyrCDS9795 [Dimorphilus gyrociliatus]|uniref:DgyrCDS9795 n=1 Tax=Dimorphilus gyrociliatus TaxID=2664684 RepID=A0A7I8VY14_9ANNE|nr:DgyrCDS9795 [Dimorphilus gyrociliatus]
MRMVQLMLVILCTVVYCQASPLKLLSFNTRLTADELYTRSRFLKTVQTLKRLDADVLCLQEVWNDEHLFSLIEDLEWKFPFSYSFVHNVGGLLNEKLDLPNSKCSEKDGDRLLKCIKNNCLNSKDSEEFHSCYVNECNPFDLNLNEACRECTTLQIEACIKIMPQNVNKDRIMECLKQIKRPRGICSSRTIDTKANHGLLMLSNVPLNSQRRGIFTKDSLIARGFLEAKNNFGEKFVCTQMTTGRSSVYSETKTHFNNWYDLKESEVEQLVNMYSQSKQTYILGNFNVGPAMPSNGIKPYYSDLYKIMEDRGLENIIVREAGKCTLCANNELAKDDISNSYIVDGCILVNVDRCRLSNEVIFKENMLLNPRTRKHYPLSDHYATLSTFCDNLELFLTSSDDGSGSGGN